jgi:hypothetical protein
VNARRIATALAAIPLLLALSACVPKAIPADVPTVAAAAPTASPVPAAEEQPLPEDVVMVVRATATADNGSVMDLTLTVHRSTLWNDPAGADLAALMTGVCAGYLDDTVYQSRQFSFARIDVAAAQRPGPDWPADRRLFLLPSGALVTVAADGFAVDDDEADGATPHCKRQKYVDGPGAGTIAVGFAGDTGSAGTADGAPKWANHDYGVAGARIAGQTAAAAGVTISGCTYLVTTAGAELDGDASWWGSTIDDTRCVTGAVNESDDS